MRLLAKANFGADTLHRKSQWNSAIQFLENTTLKLQFPTKNDFRHFFKTCKLATFPWICYDFNYFHSHTLSSKSTLYLTLVTKTELFKPLQIPMVVQHCTSKSPVARILSDIYWMTFSTQREVCVTFQIKQLWNRSKSGLSVTFFIALVFKT